MRFNPLDFQSCLTLPNRLTNADDWHGHIPFGFAIMEILNPQLVVELGVYNGDSFFTWAQAMATQRIAFESNAKLVGIDTFKGDADMGTYPEDVFNRVNAHNDENYHHFSTLKRMTFDDALNDFADSSIDLLHIDGCHDYEAVKHDYTSWLPKMASNGIILFHDVVPCFAIATNKMIVGASDFWRELRDNFPTRYFEFAHSSGLGVLAPLGTSNGYMKALFEAAHTTEFAFIQSFFASLEQHVRIVKIARQATAAAQTFQALIEQNRQHFNALRVSGDPGYGV